jgi:hypothetical protein
VRGAKILALSHVSSRTSEARRSRAASLAHGESCAAKEPKVVTLIGFFHRRQRARFNHYLS